MLYRRGNEIFSRASAIIDIANQLGIAILPNYIDDETLALYGFIPQADSTSLPSNVPTREQREKVLANVDWVSSAKQLSDKTKASVEAWRWLVRNLPEINTNSDIPPLPKIEAVDNYFVKVLLPDCDVEGIKNFVTDDEGWMTFLQVWKDFEFTRLEEVISALLAAYTSVTLDEIISSL